MVQKKTYVRQNEQGKNERGYYNYIRVWNKLSGGKAPPTKWANLNKRRAGTLTNPFQGKKFVDKQQGRFNAGAVRKAKWHKTRNLAKAKRELTRLTSAKIVERKPKPQAKAVSRKTMFAKLNKKIPKRAKPKAKPKSKPKTANTNLLAEYVAEKKRKRARKPVTKRKAAKKVVKKKPTPPKPPPKKRRKRVRIPVVPPKVVTPQPRKVVDLVSPKKGFEYGEMLDLEQADELDDPFSTMTQSDLQELEAPDKPLRKMPKKKKNPKKKPRHLRRNMAPPPVKKSGKGRRGRRRRAR